MLDTIIEGATIHDGGGGHPYRTDVALIGDRIALIGALGDRDAHERCDATGRALAPGFIDVHAHTDEGWLRDGRCTSKIRQGITTEIGGNCGFSAAPRRPDDERPWTELDEFFSAVERGGVAPNVATLVGLGTTRELIAGENDAPLDAAQLRREHDLVRRAIEQGALGVSSGLTYAPSRYADVTELVACVRAARDAGMPRYVTHLRNEGDGLLEAVDETLEIARRSGVAVHCSHHRAAGKRNWGKVERSLEMLARARVAGVEATADVCPYVATCSRLDTVLPSDATRGGSGPTLARLRDPATAAALVLRLTLDREQERWHDVVVASVESERNADLVGVRFDEIARRRRCSPARAVLEVLSEERLDVSALFFSLCEDDVAAVLSAGFVAIGSSASAKSDDDASPVRLAHPRAFGCFPRIFGRFVRGRGTLDVPEAIRRMTSFAADTFGLQDRGRIAPGACADLVVFDPATVLDTATYGEPYAYPRGVEHVWVNGRAVVRNGRATGARPGRVLRGGRAN